MPLPDGSTTLRYDSPNTNGVNYVKFDGIETAPDATLCQRALGFSPAELIPRLGGKVPLIRRLMDGVYIVFNDDPALSYPDFVRLNEVFKPILGLL